MDMLTEDSRRRDQFDRLSSMQVHRKRPSFAVVPKRKAKASLKRPKSALPRMSDQGSIHIPNPQLEKYDDEQKKAVKVLQFYIRVYLGRKRRKKAEEERKANQRIPSVRPSPILTLESTQGVRTER